MALTIGLTGGIASGKSLVADAFAALGAPVLDADVVARQVVVPGSPALAEIVARFGPRALLPDGSLDRRHLREVVFADEPSRRDLERITHPHIRARLQAWRDAQAHAYCILAVAILVEAGMDALTDRVLVVDATPEQQIARLVARDGISRDLALRMLGAQATREQRLARADDVLSNLADPQQVPGLVAELDRFYMDLARSGRKRAPGLCLPRPAA